ncbi:ABC transporter ATP-binding protein [Rhodococcus sp. HM1]|uniref:ABC transporter ATP-binding protein n=1 Tax=unclassified Rhodococcus (in: high G+C Gram-positive bacteria) TaxID=192944 RepID=UPI0018CE9058|nr:MULTISPECIES: ABC transporter ATP-binding protein [unclassified Rhodococcus (in: high G+C Gram-positive bacteria)]MBH0121258.1 ABC transporter ATP-binding protein [Rhodococcus sp. CX]MCK8671271.1 ABC transporter ATP-binding protein [Rhodococcus sp. HM1]
MKVSLSKLNLTYGDFTAVKSLDLTIDDGESVVLLGQSGCGKTSTMRCIAGLEQPTGGSIAIGETTVFDYNSNTNVPSFKRNVGMVFQSYAVWPHKTVLENVSFPLQLKKVPKKDIRRRALATLEMVGLAHLADRGASQLSGGQMQRVALARSMAMEPSVLLLDEPLSNLDARLRDDLRVELRRIQLERGLTSMYVTHDQQEALALADRIAIMQSGYITQLAAPAELYRRPNSASIARFLGVANVFSVGAIHGNGHYELSGYPMSVVAEDQRVHGEASVCFRPEDVLVESAPALPEAGAPNSWSGTVTVAVFQGATVRYQIELDGGARIEATCTETPGSARAAGEPVTVRVRPERVLVLPDDTVPTETLEVAA